MKKVYATAIVILSIVFTVNAQDIKFGAKAGVNIASVTGDINNAKSRTAFHIGGMAEIPISAEFFVQPELLFSSQGYKVDNGTGVLNYINLPIIGKYFVTDELSIEAGPQIGYLLSATIKVDEVNNGGGNGNEPLPNTATKTANTKSSSAASSLLDSDIKEFFNSTDISFGIGAGYKLENGINLSARYNIGVSNISKDNSDNIKSSIFMLSIGYFFF
ncbi:porin family protein [Algibacter sp. 2305UL17-15]|uniref:porin family protein n=1 Tax=Algibacter sp. 2305UL17-15 TaxID=3231268 RepID=UPI003458C733